MRQLAKILLVVLSLSLSGCDMGLSNQRADKEGNTVVGQSMARSKDAVCRSNISQVRAALVLFNQSGDVEDNPHSLTELKLPPEFLVCPIGKEPYEFIREESRVKCMHAGHGKY